MAARGDAIMFVENALFLIPDFELESTCLSG